MSAPCRGGAIHCGLGRGSGQRQPDRGDAAGPTKVRPTMLGGLFIDAACSRRRGPKVNDSVSSSDAERHAQQRCPLQCVQPSGSSCLLSGWASWWPLPRWAGRPRFQSGRERAQGSVARRPARATRAGDRRRRATMPDRRGAQLGLSAQFHRCRDRGVGAASAPGDRQRHFRQPSLRARARARRRGGAHEATPDGSLWILLAYLSSARAERYRSYWRPEWYDTAKRPVWLGDVNPIWDGNYDVEFWHPDWQQLMFGMPEAYLDRILAKASMRFSRPRRRAGEMGEGASVGTSRDGDVRAPARRACPRAQSGLLDGHETPRSCSMTLRSSARSTASPRRICSTASTTPRPPTSPRTWRDRSNICRWRGGPAARCWSWSI